MRNVLTSTNEYAKLQVANLGLYGIALAVFGAVKAKTCSDIVVQVTLPNQL
jgi:hypothetical protein